MTDVARLGFDIDTAPLARTNTELRSIVASATAAEKSVDKFAQRMAALASNSNAASVALAKANQNAAATVAANVAAANAQAAAHGKVAAAATNAAQAVANAARATGAAHNAAAAGATRVVASNVALGASITQVTGLFGTLFAAIGGQAILSAMDRYTQLQNTLRLTGLSGQNLIDVENRLFDAANRNGVGIELVSQLYRKAAFASAALGASQADLLTMVDGVTAALRVQGTGTKKAEGALLQMGQAFGTGTVRAEEWNAVIEGAYPVAQAAARGIAGMEGNTNKLNMAVKAGQITSKMFFDGIVKGSKLTEEQAKAASLTISGSYEAMTNKFTNFIGKFDEATGASSGLISALNTIGDLFNTLAKDPEFLDEMRKGFEHVTDVIRATFKEAVGLINALKAIWQIGVDFAREQNVVGARNVLSSANKDVDSAQTTAAKAKNRIDQATAEIALGDKLGRQTAASEKRRNEATAEYATAIGVVNEALKAQKKAEQDVLNYGIGSVNAPPQITTRELGGKAGFPLPPGGTGDPVDKKAAALEKAYQKILLDGRQFIEQQQIEIDVLGQSAEETARLKHAHELLSKVQDAGIPVTKRVAEGIADMAKKMAEAESKKDLAKFVFEFTQASEEFVREQQVELDVLGMSAKAAYAYRIEQEKLADAKKKGLPVGAAEADAIRAGAEAMAEAKDKVDKYRDALDFTKGIFKDFFSDMKDALYQGKDLWKAFGDAAMGVLSKIADKLLNMAIDELFANAFGGAAGGGSSGSATGGGLSGAAGRNNGGSGGISGAFGGIKNMFSNGFDALGDMWGVTKNWFSSLGGAPTDVGQLMAQQGLGGAGLGFGNILGAAGGAASGIMQLVNGKGSTGSMIGGIGSMIGAGVSLIPGIGQIAGPIIGILSSLAGSFIKEAPPKITNQAYGQLQYGGKGYGTNGGAWGPDANAKTLEGPLGEMGKTMQGLYDLMGGVKDATKVWGVALESFSQKQGDNTFQNATSFVVDPNGNKKQWGQGDDPGLSNAGANAAINSILTGAVGTISENMRKALGPLQNPDLEALTTVVTEIMNFDKVMDSFGKTVTVAQTALDAIDEQFKGLTDTATKYGLDVVKVTDQLAKAKTKVATDFADTLQRAIDDRSDTSKGLLADLAKEEQAARDNNTALLKADIGAQDQILKIEQVYGAKRADIVQAVNEAALAKAADAWKTVPELARGQFLFTERQKLKDQLSQMSDETSAIGGNPMAIQIKGWQKEMGAFMTSVASTFGVGSEEYFNATIASYTKFNAQMKAANDNFIKTMNDGYNKLRDPAGAQALSVWEQRMADIQTAMSIDGPFFDGILRVGPAVTAAMRRWNEEIFKAARDMNENVTQSLLSISDPHAAVLAQIDKEKKDAIAQAVAINGNVSKVLEEQAERAAAVDKIRSDSEWGITYLHKEAAKNNRDLTKSEQEQIVVMEGQITAADAASASMMAMWRTQDATFVNLADINELYLQKKLKAEQDYYAASLGGLDTIIRRLRYGDLSGVGKPEALAGAQGTFDAAWAKVQAEKTPENVSAVISATEALSQQLRENLTSSEEFYTRNSDLADKMEQISAYIQGGSSTGTNTAANTNTGMSADAIALLGYQQAQDKIRDAREEETLKELKLLREAFTKVVNGQ